MAGKTTKCALSKKQYWKVKFFMIARDRSDLSTDVRIIEAAETLFSLTSGLSTPLREIIRLAGVKNSSAVVYHFENKEGLIEAVFANRLATLDARRMELLSALGQRDCELEDLMRIFLLPLAELRDESGRRCYAGFLRNLFAHDPTFAKRLQNDHMAPVSRYILNLIHKTRPDLDEMQFRHQMTAGGVLFLNEMHILDHGSGGPESEAIEFAIRMASAVMITK